MFVDAVDSSTAYDVAVFGDGGVDVIADVDVVDVDGAPPPLSPPSQYVILSALSPPRHHQS